MLSLIRTWVLACAGAAAAVLTPSLAQADMPITYKADGQALFTLTVPDFWSARAGGGRSLTAPGSDETRHINRLIGLKPVADTGIWMGFISPHGVSNFEDALEYLRGVGPFLVKDPQVQERGRITIGGLPAGRVTGTGRRDGKAVSFTAVVIDLPRNRMAVSVVVMEAGVNPDLVSDVNAVFASFRATR